MLNRWVEDTSGINCRDGVTLRGLKIAGIESRAHEKYRAAWARPGGRCRGSVKTASRSLGNGYLFMLSRRH